MTAESFTLEPSQLVMFQLQKLLALILEEPCQLDHLIYTTGVGIKAQISHLIKLI